MLSCRKLLIVIIIALCLTPFLGLSAEQEAAEQWPPKGDGFSIPILLGPEGTGLGLGYIWNDFLGKEDRFLQLHSVFCQTAYRQYMIEYHEPDLISDGDQLLFRAFYNRRTGVHYFGKGPDSDIDDAAYYGTENLLVTLGYSYPLPMNMGISGYLIYDNYNLKDEDLESPEFHADYPSLDRRFEQAYPHLFESDEFKKKPNHHAWKLSLFHDDQQGIPRAFPTGGGYRKVSVSRVDEAQDADWNYWHYTAEAAQFVSLRDEYNVLAVHARWDRLDGENIPFYKLLSLGHARYSISYVADGIGQRGYWENRFVDRNRWLGMVELRHRTRAGWWKESWNEYKIMDLAGEALPNTSTYLWTDMGQVWPDGVVPEDMRISYGLGFNFHSDNGMAMQTQLGFSDELSSYLSFSYYQQF